MILVFGPWCSGVVGSLKGILIGILVHVIAILEVIRGQAAGLTRYALMLKTC